MCAERRVEVEIMRASEKLDAALRTEAGRMAVRKVLRGGKAWVEIDGKPVQIGMRRTKKGPVTDTGEKRGENGADRARKVS